MSDTVPKSAIGKDAAADAADSAEQTEQVTRLLRKEISHAASLLLKVQHGKAGRYAQAMADAASKQGDQEDHEYWKRIAKEVNKRLAEAPPASGGGTK